jgi:hypothetical protein
LYLALQSVFSTLNHTGGDSDIAGSDAIRFANFGLSGISNLANSRNKTGNRENAQGVITGRGAQSTLEFDLELSGTPGTAPQQGKIFSSALGDAAPVIGTGASAISGSADNGSGKIRVTQATHGYDSGDAVRIQGHSLSELNYTWLITVNDANTYDLIGPDFTANGTGGTGSRVHATYTDGDDAVVPFEAHDRRDGGSDMHEAIGVGCLISSLELRAGEDFLQVSAQVAAAWDLAKGYFSTASTAEKAGLTSFPAEPTPSYVGGPVSGREGYLIVDGNVVESGLRIGFTINTGFAYPTPDRNGFNALLASRVLKGEKTVTCDLGTVLAADPYLVNMFTKARTKEPVNIYATLGSVAGKMLIIAVDNVQLDSPQLQDADPEKDANFTGSAFSPHNVRIICA